MRARCEKPVFSVTGGLYGAGQTLSVEITADPDALIFYTLDCSEPSTSSRVYSGPIPVSGNTVIRAIATRERDFARLKEALLGTRKEHPGFLMHGVAETKWKERRRRFLLERFLEERHQDVPGYEWLATVNLSSIMAKLAKKK